MALLAFGLMGTIGTTATAGGVNECQDMKPGWIFCSCFEEGNKAIWNDYDGNPDTENQLVLDPGPLNLSSNHVMRFRVPPGSQGADLVKVLPGSYDKLYARWYIKYEANFDLNANNHGGGLFGGDRNNLGRSGIRPNGTDMISAVVDFKPASPYAHTYRFYTYYRGMYQDCADPNGSCWGDAFPCTYDNGQTYCTKPDDRPTLPLPSLVTGRWYCVEIMVDLGAPSADGTGATGAMALWVDDQSLGSWSNLWFRTTPALKLNILWLSLFLHQSPTIERNLMYDNVVVSTQRIGPIAGRNVRPVITNFTLSGANSVISFSTVAGQTYDMQRASELMSGVWSLVATNIAGTGGTIQLTDTNALSQSSLFYRVRLSP
jgi:hypothetical protein